MNESKIRTRRVHKHVKDCWALAEAGKARWPAPWSSYPEGTHTANKNGAGHGTTLWIKFRCIQTDCPAVLWVAADDILIAAKVTE